MNIVITSGGTSEDIDKVRKITNRSSGKLGSMIADEFVNKYDKNIGKIYYLCPKNAILPQINKKIEIINITNTQSLKDKIEEILTQNKIDVFIHSMAVSDYTVDFVEDENGKILDSEKISSNLNKLIIHLKQTPKIISMVKQLSPKTKLVGFKLLSNVNQDDLITAAKNLMDKNNCDFVLANDITNISKEKHIGYLINKDKKFTILQTKQEIANAIVKSVIRWENKNMKLFILKKLQTK